MTIAVIVPLFNKRDFVGETIASLAAQEAPPDQLILVDDASTDGGPAVAERALAVHAEALRSTRLNLIWRPRNGGPGAARNAGIERADTDLILCLDADDRLRPDALRRIREAMRRHELAMMVLGYASDPPGEDFPDLRCFPDEVTPLGNEAYLLDDPLRAAAHPEFIMGRASNVAVRRRWLGEQRYCTDARLNEGVDLWYRVLKAIVAGGGRAGLHAAPLIAFRVTDQSLSHRRVDDWRALEMPPTVRRYRDSMDPHDRAMAAMLAGRWLAHARAVLPEDQKRAFAAQHRALLAGMGVEATA